MKDAPFLAHISLYRATCIDKTPQDQCVDIVDAVSAPTLVKIVE
jgi:hypothetical protein